MDAQSIRDLSQSLTRARAGICQLGDHNSAEIEELLQMLRDTTLSLVDAIDGHGVRRSALLSLPRELQVHILRKCDALTLANLDCTCKSFHIPLPTHAPTGTPVQGLSLVEEAVHACLKLPGDPDLESLAKHTPPKISATRQHNRMQHIFDIGDEWLVKLLYRHHDDQAQLTLPDLSIAAEEVSIALEAVAQAALFRRHPPPMRLLFPPAEHLLRDLQAVPDAPGSLSQEEVYRCALNLFGNTYERSQGANYLCGTLCPTVGDLSVRLVVEAIATPASTEANTEAAQPLHTLACAVALRMVSIMMPLNSTMMSLSMATPVLTWLQQRFVQRHHSDDRCATLHVPLADVRSDCQADVKRSIDEYVRAGALLRAVWLRRREVVGHRDQETMVLAGYAAWLLTESKQTADAEDVLRALVEANETVHGRWHVETVSSRALLSEVLIFTEQWPEARAVLSELTPADGRRAEVDGSGVVRSVDGEECYPYYNPHERRGFYIEETLAHLRELGQLDTAEALVRMRLSLAQGPWYMGGLFFSGLCAIDIEGLEKQLNDLMVAQGRFGDVEIARLHGDIQRELEVEQEMELAGWELETHHSSRERSWKERRDMQPPKSMRLRMELVELLEKAGRAAEVTLEREAILTAAVEAVCLNYDHILATARRDGKVQANYERRTPSPAEPKPVPSLPAFSAALSLSWASVRSRVEQLLVRL